MIILKILQRGLKKEEIALAKRYQKWYKVTEDEIRLFVNEGTMSNEKEVVNRIDHKNNKAYLCMGDIEYSKKFYEKHKNLKLRLYVKSDVGNLYNEYRVNDWQASEKGLELFLL
ncbi:MAG: hypothetical protein ACRC3Y_11370 [Romboutsia sp.]|uniref:hypothetical protein n=1 Tax=Romboutsia sp. TaxID=1965302 RepID=UPI003F38818E